MVLLGLVLLYTFIHNIPTDLGPIDERMGMALRPGHVVHGIQELKEPSGAPKYDEVTDDVGEHYYNGPIKFYRLATTLHGIARTMGSRQANKNVLFAASSLKSVANILPMACEMGKWERNYVHMAILGRDPLSLEDILEVNGVHSKNSCTVYFHDARADYAQYSSDQRAEVSVSGAMKHINDFMHPQAIIMDDSSLEDQFFIRAMRKKAKDIRRTLIEVPDGRYEDFLWMTRLDSGSLASWHRLSIDILIHAPPDSSGGLIRLIKSLEKADYTGLRPPKLTIELPTNIESSVTRYLEWMDWPPDEKASPYSLRTNALSFRHRIPSSRVTSEQASLRFLESFYPTNAYDNHGLILSPQVELDPMFLQYLYYVILEYRYSAYGAPESGEILGLSLDVPTTFLNGKDGFKQPKMSDMDTEDDPKFEDLDQTAQAPFLYQAPSSTATLIFGDKWATFHNFLSNRIAASQTGKAEKPQKLVSETEPAWAEYLLELMRARGWTMLHPASPFVTVHNELAHIPEEYLREPKKDRKEDELPQELPRSEEGEEAFLTASDPPTLQPHVEQEANKGVLPLQDVLPFNGDLPELPQLPHLYHDGKLIGPDEMRELQDRYVLHFRQHIGGCSATDAERKRFVQFMSTNDLFCLPGIDPQIDDGPQFDDGQEGGDEHEDEQVAEAIVQATEPSADLGGLFGGPTAGKASVETKEAVAGEADADGR